VPKPTPTPAGTPSPAPTSSPSPRPSRAPSPTPAPTASSSPQVIHIGFELDEFTDPTYGPVWYYALTPGNRAQVVVVKSGSQVVFLNDGPPSTQHTAGGFGTSGFPANNDNENPFTQTGSTIDSSLTWSTGTLNPGQSSQVFTVGPPGAYYFGCGFHYAGPPTSTNESMGDVLVSQ
jgi:plastocyanin